MTSEKSEKTGRGGTSESQVPAALFGLCPRCGSRTLFAGPVRFASACSACRLDFSRFNVGDGPAAFLTLIVGGFVTALAIWFELAVSPPFWLHILLWLPLTLIAVAYGLRVSKAWLLQAEYWRSAGEAGGTAILPEDVSRGGE